MLQPQAMLLERVPGASTDPTVQQELTHFCSKQNWQRQEVLLELSEKWPMARKRWWTVLYPPEWRRFTLTPWQPITPQMTLKDVFPTLGEWADHDEVALTLSQKELEYYLDSIFGRERRLLLPSDVVPTALHSYSVALQECPCGCRAQQFSHNCLLNKGLRGYFVQSPKTQQPRYLHPKELATLFTVSPHHITALTPRESNCLLGLAWLWTFTHLLEGASKHIPTLGPINPAQTINTYKRELTLQAKMHICTQPSTLQTLTIHTTEGAPITLACPESATVAHFLRAEQITLDWGIAQSLKEGSLHLPEQLGLYAAAQADITLIRQSKRQRTAAPIGELTIALVHKDQYRMTFVTAGSFIFQALRQADIQANWVTDEDGKIFGADTRVWGSQRYFVLDESAFPTLRTTQAFGFPDRQFTDPGLTEEAVSTAMQSILEQCTDSHQARPLLLKPLWLEDEDLDDALHQQRHWLQAAFNFSNDTLFLPCVEANHRILLQASEQVDGLHWVVFDGLRTGLSTPIISLTHDLTMLLELTHMDTTLHTFTSHRQTATPVAPFRMHMFGNYTNCCEHTTQHPL